MWPEVTTFEIVSKDRKLDSHVRKCYGHLH